MATLRHVLLAAATLSGILAFGVWTVGRSAAGAPPSAKDPPVTPEPRAESSPSAAAVVEPPPRRPKADESPPVAPPHGKGATTLRVEGLSAGLARCVRLELLDRGARSVAAAVSLDEDGRVTVPLIGSTSASIALAGESPGRIVLATSAGDGVFEPSSAEIVLHAEEALVALVVTERGRPVDFALRPGERLFPCAVVRRRRVEDLAEFVFRLEGGRAVRLPAAAIERDGDLWTASIERAGPVPESEPTPIVARSPQRWTVTLRDPLPAGLDPTLVLDGHRSEGSPSAGSWWVDLDAPPRLDSVVRLDLWRLKASLSASVAAVHAAALTAELRADLRSLLWTRILYRPLRGGAWRLQLFADASNPLEGVVSGDLVPLPAGARRSACIIEVIDGLEQVTAWVELRGGAASRQITPRGRWATIRFAHRPATALAVMKGAGGGSVGLRFANPPEPRPLFVPEGTSELIITVEPGGVRHLDPTADEIVVR